MPWHMHNYPSFLLNTYKVSGSILPPALDIALQKRYKSVADIPDESSKRHQLLRCPEVPIEQSLEADFNYVNTEGNILLAVSLVPNVML